MKAAIAIDSAQEAGRPVEQGRVHRLELGTGGTGRGRAGGQRQDEAIWNGKAAAAIKVMVWCLSGWVAGKCSGERSGQGCDHRCRWSPRDIKVRVAPCDALCAAVGAAQVAADLVDVGAAQGRIGGVVGTDRIPRVAQALDVAGEDPGADVDAGARVEEIALADAVGGQRGSHAELICMSPMSRVPLRLRPTACGSSADSVRAIA